MASGRAHDLATKQITIPTTVIMGLVLIPIIGIGWGIVGAGLTFVGLMLQRLMTPDADQEQETHAEFLAYKLNQFFGVAWVLFWLPYAKLIPHRHFLSHSPVLSTLIRVVYLFIPIYLGNLIGIKPLIYVWTYLIFYWDLTLYFVIGIIIGDLGHLLLDYNKTARNHFERKVAKQFRKRRYSVEYKYPEHKILEWG